MPTFFSYSVPSGEAATTTIGTGASTAEIVLGVNALFAVSTVGTTASFIKFGNAGMAAAAATDFQLPPNSLTYFDTGAAFDRIRIFDAATATHSVQKLSRS